MCQCGKGHSRSIWRQGESGKVSMTGHNGQKWCSLSSLPKPWPGLWVMINDGASFALSWVSIRHCIWSHPSPHPILPQTINCLLPLSLQFFHSPMSILTQNTWFIESVYWILAGCAMSPVVLLTWYSFLVRGLSVRFCHFQPHSEQTFNLSRALWIFPHATQLSHQRIVCSLCLLLPL